MLTLDAPRWPWDEPGYDGPDLTPGPLPSSPSVTGRTGAIACVIGTDANGVLVGIFGPDRIAIGYDSTDAERALVVLPALVNLAPCTFDSGAWNASGGTVTDEDEVGPDGYQTAALISGTNTEGYLLGPLTLGAAATLTVRGFVRADVAHTARALLKNNSGSTIDTEDIGVGTTWTAFSIGLVWDGSTSGVGSILFSGSNGAGAQAIHLSPLIYVGTVSGREGVIPIGSPGATVPSLSGLALTERINREGELQIDLHAGDNDATVGTLWNGANGNDKREIRIEGGRVYGDHADGSATVESAEISVFSVDITLRWQAKLRWQRAALADNTTNQYTSVRAEDGSSADSATGRSATWTASTAPATRLDVGHDGGADVVAGLVFGVSVKAREPRL